MVSYYCPRTTLRFGLKCRFPEDRVRGPWRSLNMSPFDREPMTFYWCSIVTMALSRVISEIIQCRKISLPWSPGQGSIKVIEFWVSSTELFSTKILQCWYQCITSRWWDHILETAQSYGARTTQKIKPYMRGFNTASQECLQFEVLAIREATQQTGIMVTEGKTKQGWLDRDIQDDQRLVIGAMVSLLCSCRKQYYKRA